MAWHYTPQHSIERWVVPTGEQAGKVWRYERGGSISPKPIPPRVAAAENYLYAPDHGPEVRSTALEIWLSENIDGPGAAVIQKLIDRKPLTKTEADVAALYFGFQAFRVPRVRDTISALATSKVHADSRNFARNDREELLRILRNFDPSGTIDDVDGFVERARGDGPLHVTASNVIWLQQLQVHGRKIARQIRNIPWMVVEAPGDLEFVTSDNPVATGCAPTYTAATHAGWGVPGAEHTLPLDPKHVLFVARHALGKMRNHATWCRDVVRRKVVQSQRYVFSRILNRQVEWYLQEPMQ